MSYRRGAPSCDPKAVERREWYNTLQEQMYYKTSDGDDSDEEKLPPIASRKHSTNSQSTTAASGRTTAHKNTVSSRVTTASEVDTADSPTFVNFAASLAFESSDRMAKANDSIRSSETYLSSSKAIKHYDSDFLDGVLLKLNEPPETRYATISCWCRCHIIVNIL